MWLCIEYASDNIYEKSTCQSYFIIKVRSICDLLTTMLEIPSSGNYLNLLSNVARKTIQNPPSPPARLLLPII
jgi:hypothetical protein